MQAPSQGIASGLGQFQGTGGFMNPDVIAMEFGLSPGMKVADFGSGAGYFTILMAKLVGKSGMVTALDVMATALESVRVKAKAAGLENILTTRANLEVLGSSGLSAESQDMVLLANILFQSNKKDLIFKEALRVLKKGGKLVVIDWKKGSLSGQGGFGPPEDLRTDPKSMKSIAAKEGLNFEKDIDAGSFHYGMAFRK